MTETRSLTAKAMTSSSDQSSSNISPAANTGTNNSIDQVQQQGSGADSINVDNPALNVILGRLPFMNSVASTGLDQKGLSLPVVPSVSGPDNEIALPSSPPAPAAAPAADNNSNDNGSDNKNSANVSGSDNEDNNNNNVVDANTTSQDQAYLQQQAQALLQTQLMN